MCGVICISNTLDSRVKSQSNLFHEVPSISRDPVCRTRMNITNITSPLLGAFKRNADINETAGLFLKCFSFCFCFFVFCFVQNGMKYQGLKCSLVSVFKPLRDFNFSARSCCSTRWLGVGLWYSRLVSLGVVYPGYRSSGQ